MTNTRTSHKNVALNVPIAPYVIKSPCRLCLPQYHQNCWCRGAYRKPGLYLVLTFQKVIYEKLLNTEGTKKGNMGCNNDRAVGTASLCQTSIHHLGFIWENDHLFMNFCPQIQLKIYSCDIKFGLFQ